jgi:phage shock protein A
MERVSRLMTSDLGGLLDRAEDPGATVEALLDDLEETIIDLRREMVTAVARQNRVRKQLFAAEGAAGRVEREASLALARGEELRARHTLSRAIGTLRIRDELEVELDSAGRMSARLVAALIRLEDRAQDARRKQDEVGRRRGGAPRRGAAESMSAIRRRLGDPGRQGTFDGYTEAVGALELEAARAVDDEGGGRC